MFWLPVHSMSVRMSSSQSLKFQIDWALTKPEQLVRVPGTTLKAQRKDKMQKEREWGNAMIGQVNNGQWTTLLGENLVRDVLRLRGETPRRPDKRGGFQPDWETDSFVYEVKTSNWWVDGTAGEKVFGTWIKYQDIPDLYGKPLRIVCVARQEHELEYGKVQYFGKGVKGKTKAALALASSWGIEYVRFSDLVADVKHQL